MTALRSVGARLSLALLLVVAGALAIVYLIVVPSLEKRLVNAKMTQLERAAPSLRRQFLANPLDPDFIDNASASANARVVLFAPLSQSAPALRVVSDSRLGVNSSDVEDDPVALRTSLALRLQHGTVTRNDERFAEAAVPVATDGSVLLLSASLRDSLGNVHLVQRRLLLAGLLALVVALVLGYGGARVFAARIRRLERAADRIAGGRFDEPVLDAGADELGELAAAFDRMRQRLAQLDHARREFIANASHELRTPIFSLGGFLELLADEELDEETQREFLATMREQVDRLTKLATELLDLSRLDAGLQVDLAPIDLAELARAVVDEFQAVALAEEHGLELSAEAAAPGLGDDQRVLQIGRILVENAILHTPPGTAVRVRARSDGGRALLAVEDDGPGVPAEQTEHLFERFYRIEGVRASGSGLGLAIARELAERMEGSVEFESRPGRTVFTLVLPAAAGSERSERHAAEPVEI